MSQDAVITLYASIQEPERLWESIQRHFADVSKEFRQEEAMAEIRLQDDSVMQFHLSSEQEEVSAQVSGMAAYFAQAPCENKQLMERVQLQISLFTCILGVSFTIDEDEARTNAVIGRIYDVAKGCACILLYPDMTLYTPDGDLLLSIEGESELEDWCPISCEDILGKAPVFGAVDEQRYETVTKELQEKGFPHVSYQLSTQLTSDTMQRPSLETIAKRAIAVFACAVCAEGTLMEDGSREIGLQEFQLLDEVFGCRRYLSERELAFIEGEPTQHESVQMSWRYECSAVLLWALGLYELDLSFADLCDVGAMAQRIRAFESLEQLCAAAKSVEIDQLLDAHTRVLYYDWSCVEARIKQLVMEGIEPGVVQEQHYALNWLCGANHTENWDEIQCNT